MKFRSCIQCNQSAGRRFTGSYSCKACFSTVTLMANKLWSPPSSWEDTPLRRGYSSTCLNAAEASSLLMRIFIANYKSSSHRSTSQSADQIHKRKVAPHNAIHRSILGYRSKAVADGAIGFYCDHHVSARVAKFMYGVEFLRELDPRDPDHVSRQERLCELPSGPKLLPDAFDCILSRVCLSTSSMPSSEHSFSTILQGAKVKESTVFTRKYCTELTSLSMLSVFEVEIWCYRGGNTIPKWINRQAG